MAGRPRLAVPDSQSHETSRPSAVFLGQGFAAQRLWPSDADKIRPALGPVELDSIDVQIAPSIQKRLAINQRQLHKNTINPGKGSDIFSFHIEKLLVGNLGFSDAWDGLHGAFTLLSSPGGLSVFGGFFRRLHRCQNPISVGREPCNRPSASSWALAQAARIWPTVTPAFDQAVASGQNFFRS